MLLLEQDAKDFLAQRGFAVPEGHRWNPDAPALPDGPGPFVMKAQVPVGGRGKAGGIRMVAGPADAEQAARDIAALTIRGHAVRGLRIEAAVSGAQEVYVGLSVDAARGLVAVMASDAGGVDVEDTADAAMHTVHAAPEPEALADAVAALAARFGDPVAQAVADAGSRMARAFLDLDATLLEINPLFVRPDGTWVAGDARMDLDESALPRQPDLAALLDTRAVDYPDAVFKRAQGYDLVVVDPDGEIGLVTTGAGLSMKLIDEMTAQGLRPYNFCDIRSGMMRGDPARLIEALRRMAEGPRVRCVLVNIFAGITDLGEFAGLLVQAVRALPGLDLPLIVRLVGNNEAKAEEILRASGLPMAIEPDLERAVALSATAGTGAAR